MDCETLSFEEAFNRLEESVSQLDQGNLSLEEALSLFEQGMRLVTRCNTLLDSAELRISLLMPAADEGYQATPFDAV